MFRKMPIVLLMLIFGIIVIDPLLPLSLKQFFYSVSLTLKSLLVFCLPFVIFSLLFKAAVSLAHNATRVIAFILISVCVSSFISLFLSHWVGSWVYGFDLSLIFPKDTQGLESLWALKLPAFFPNDVAMFAGILCGILLAWRKADLAQKIAHKLDQAIARFLTSFAIIIPLFVTGFVMKLQSDGVMLTILKDYTLIFVVIAVAQFSYIGVAYFVLSKFQPRVFFQMLRNILPAAMAGFSTMSSAAAMPLTILGTEKNAHNKDLARSIIPATVNIHLVGDCFATPIFAYAILKNYGLADPSLFHYCVFAFYFVLAKFSVAAIPGGGIIVMIPILEKYLGFNHEMSSLITALYILFDPLITSANVLGNGAFAKTADFLSGLVARRKALSTT